MEPRRLIGSGIAASALGHLSVLALVLFLAEVHPFGSVTAEPMTVDLVSPAEVPPPAAKEDPVAPPKATPADALDVATKPAATSSPAPAAPPAAAQPQKQAALATPRPNRQQAAPQPPAPPPQPPPAASAPAYIPPEPDVSVKYHVMLGLPPELPQVKSGDDNFDAPASKLADISSNLVAEFRRHLKTCSKLPESIEASDRVKIVLRVLMTPEGKLATEPILIEASASAKGPLLMQGAIGALQACQPYAMLPADRYGEWKVLDLSFTPRDFAGG
jgi:hypothetical protein